MQLFKRKIRHFLYLISTAYLLVMLVLILQNLKVI